MHVHPAIHCTYTTTLLLYVRYTTNYQLGHAPQVELSSYPINSLFLICCTSHTRLDNSPIASLFLHLRTIDWTGQSVPTYSTVSTVPCSILQIHSVVALIYSFIPYRKSIPVATFTKKHIRCTLVFLL